MFQLDLFSFDENSSGTRHEFARVRLIQLVKMIGDVMLFAEYLQNIRDIFEPKLDWSSDSIDYFLCKEELLRIFSPLFSDTFDHFFLPFLEADL